MRMLKKLIANIEPLDQAAMAAADRHWSAIAHPLGSLGLLEESITHIAGITGTANFDISRRAVVAMCADNGVVEEGISQTGQEVTAIVTENMAVGNASVCAMARVARADVIPVDIGVARTVEGAVIRQKNVRRGTANMTKGPSMTREEAEQAILAGIEIVRELKEAGYGLLATGEMGIGNTTTSSAVTAVLLNVPVAEVTGRGAGLSSEGLERKIRAIKKAIEVNQPDPSDPVDVLAKVGGLDICGLVGVFLGGAIYRIPVLVDGFISSVAALATVRLCPKAKEYMLGSHASDEPAGRMVLDAIGLRPFLYAGMRLGEGTGAVAVIPLLDMGLAVYRDMCTFEDTDIEAYQPLT